MAVALVRWLVNQKMLPLQESCGVEYANSMKISPNAQAFITMSCNHCDDPQCLKVCPADTYTKRADGIVIQDHDKCIGCQMCIMACPYNAPVYDPVEGKTSKCNMCADRIDEGLKPRCVESCPTGAIEFGEIEDLRQKTYHKLGIIRKTLWGS